VIGIPSGFRCQICPSNLFRSLRPGTTHNADGITSCKSIRDFKFSDEVAISGKLVGCGWRKSVLRLQWPLQLRLFGANSFDRLPFPPTDHKTRERWRRDVLICTANQRTSSHRRRTSESFVDFCPMIFASRQNRFKTAPAMCEASVLPIFAQKFYQFRTV
jgi:hypothetical protein